MKRSIAQKRAIGYAFRRKQEEKRAAFIEAQGLREEFQKSGYKSRLWFLKSKKLPCYF